MGFWVLGFIAIFISLCCWKKRNSGATFTKTTDRSNMTHGNDKTDMLHCRFCF